MLRPRRNPTTLNYYLGWRLLRAARDVDRRETTRNVELRRGERENPLEYNEAEFIKRYRLTKEAFEFLCNELRAKTSLKSTKRVSLEQKVLCALLFYATGSYQRIVGMGKHLGQTTVSMYIEEVTSALNEREILNTYIKFPTTLEERNLTKQKFYTKFGIPGVIGCIDGSHFHIVHPTKAIEHLFYCRKHFHSLNVQMICDSDCRIINVNPKYGGATHDAFIWENSCINEFMQGLHRNHEQVWLLGDSGYPQRPWMMTPIPDAVEGSPEAKYTTIHGKCRVVIENTFGRLKNRWRCLSKDRTLHYAPVKCAKIITACSVLHNLALNFGVPDPDDEVAESGVEYTRLEVPRDHGARDDLIRGRAIRSLLVDRINRLH